MGAARPNGGWNHRFQFVERLVAVRHTAGLIPCSLELLVDLLRQHLGAVPDLSEELLDVLDSLFIARLVEENYCFAVVDQTTPGQIRRSEHGHAIEQIYLRVEIVCEIPDCAVAGS
ncbi:hypothetical protein D3C86_1336750 [compost metagenome]